MPREYFNSPTISQLATGQLVSRINEGAWLVCKKSCKIIFSTWREFRFLNGCWTCIMHDITFVIRRGMKIRLVLIQLCILMTSQVIDMRAMQVTLHWCKLADFTVPFLKDCWINSIGSMFSSPKVSAWESNLSKWNSEIESLMY